MEKEICILKNFRNILDAITDTDCTDLDNAIKTIEEAMKLKTCLGCLHCNKAYQLTSCPPQYELNCGVFKTVFANDFKQYCSRYEPKDNQ